MFQDVLSYLEAQISKDEGERLKLYTDTVGKTTIGRGRNLTDRGISVDEMELMYRNDVDSIIRDLDHFLPWWRSSLSEPRQYVLMNLCFMGITRLLTFHNMLAALRVGDYDNAAAELLDSKYATQVGARADRLAQILKTGEYL